MNDDVLLQAGRTDRRALERDSHAGISPHVLELSLVRVQMRREQIVALHRDPYAGHLRGAVRAARDQMAERARPDELLGAVRKEQSATESKRDRSKLNSRSKPAEESCMSGKLAQRATVVALVCATVVAALAAHLATTHDLGRRRAERGVDAAHRIADGLRRRAYFLEDVADMVGVHDDADV